MNILYCDCICCVCRTFLLGLHVTSQSTKRTRNKCMYFVKRTYWSPSSDVWINQQYIHNTASSTCYSMTRHPRRVIQWHVIPHVLCNGTSSPTFYAMARHPRRVIQWHVILDVLSNGTSSPTCYPMTRHPRRVTTALVISSFWYVSSKNLYWSIHCRVSSRCELMFVHHGSSWPWTLCVVGWLLHTLAQTSVSCGSPWSWTLCVSGLM